LGRSYASQAFAVIRTALRREMLLELMRVWDTSSGEQHVKIDSTFDHLSVTCAWPHCLQINVSVDPVLVACAQPIVQQQTVSVAPA
jgi:hypothetical protein